MAGSQKNLAGSLLPPIDPFAVSRRFLGDAVRLSPANSNDSQGSEGSQGPGFIS